MLRKWLYAALVLVLAAVSASAHEVTYKGTVIEVEQNRYAASDGVLGTIEIRVTPGNRARTFDITAHTRIWRGESPVEFTDARIEPGEPVAVMWIDEEAEKGAREIRLEPRGARTKS